LQLIAAYSELNAREALDKRHQHVERMCDEKCSTTLRYSIMKRILIADDHEMVRAGLRALMEGHVGWAIVAEARNGNEAVSQAIESRPDVAIVDYSMPLMTGIEVARYIRKHCSATEVLIFTIHDSEDLAVEAFQAGARAFLLKSDANKMLLAAVETLMVHKSFYSGAFSSELKRITTTRNDQRQMLSPREKTIVKLVAEGHSNKAVSSILNISIKTVETHRAAVMRKLEINSTAILVRYAVRNKLVEA
jgi:DNA-binding NarL/FixJ family response regulator